MSYRGFKHLLGESSLERKCRFIFGGGILILITASFYWYGRKSETMVRDQNLRGCRMIVNRVLLRTHWVNLEQYHDFRPVIENLCTGLDELLPSDSRLYEHKFMQPGNEVLRPESSFEYDAMELFQKGRVQEHTRFLSGEAKFQFITAIRLKEDCRSCHQMHKTGKSTNDNDLWAAVSVIVPTGEMNREIQTNRGFLITTAVFIAVVAMFFSWIIVRYIIVKPVKHLKDVSDAVSAGNIDVRADIQTRDEFEELCHAFNRMLRNLVAMQEELRGLNRQLDKKVDELAQANMALFEMNRLKSDFLATMSHELRTPLNSIIGFSEILSGNDSLTEKERRYATNIQSSGKMLLGLINDILDLAKIESGKMELHLEEFSVRDVVEGLLTMARPIAEKKLIDLIVDIDEDVPVVFQDAGKLQQILYNLLSNAIKFTPEGGRVTVSAEATERDLVLAVADTGVGIAPEDRERIFEKFRQGAGGFVGGETTLTRQYSGTGLGLSIVRELCRMLGGEITLASELGKGSAFTVQLPLRVEKGLQFRVPFSDERIDLSKARKIEVQLLASSAAGGSA